MAIRTPVHFDDEIFLQRGVYYYRGTPVGSKRRIERSLELPEKTPQKEVLKAKKKLLQELELVGETGGKTTFRFLAEKYKADRREECYGKGIEKPISKSTLQETEILIDRHFVPYFGDMRVEEFDPIKFDNYCRYKKKDNLNLVNHRKVLSHFINNWCVRNGYLKYQMKLEIPKVASKARREREVLTDDEVKRLLSTKYPKALLYIVLYLLHGMRNMEICKLRWDEIDFEKRGLYVNPENNRRRKARAIPLNDFAIGLLQAAPKTSEWVFPNRRGKHAKTPYMSPYGGIRKPFKAALKEAGITRHITPHDLRSTFETYMHVNPNYTDTQREKMAGAQIDVQKKTYVKMQIEQLRGLENAVQAQVPELKKIMDKQIRSIRGGKHGGKSPRKKA